MYMRQFLQSIQRMSQSTAIWSSAMRNILRLIAITVFGMVALLCVEADNKYYAGYSADGITLKPFVAENTSGFVSVVIVHSHQNIPSENNEDSFFEDNTDEEDENHYSHPLSGILFNDGSTHTHISCIYTGTSPLQTIPLYIMFHSWKHYITFS